jgi:hypothetical protein
MRTLVIGAALATLIASPAFAQAYDPTYGSANLTFPPGAANRSAPVVPPRATDNVSPAMADHLAFGPGSGPAPSYAYAPKSEAAHAQQPRHRRVHVQNRRNDMEN